MFLCPLAVLIPFQYTHSLTFSTLTAITYKNIIVIYIVFNRFGVGLHLIISKNTIGLTSIILLA